MIATLYAIAVAVLVIYGLNLLWLAMGFLRHDKSDDGAGPVVRGWDSNSHAEQATDMTHVREVPQVTVQLPIYNERYVAGRLIDACAALDYPSDRLQIQVLDDSTDDTVGIVAERVAHWRRHGLDVTHVRRADRVGFKAGALEAGLSAARGAFIAIFDADFLPPADFLKTTLPHFADERVGMVQTRWSYLNRDWSILTRLQALGLDAHFAVEQFVRSRTGCFINFNGTAGIWRRACIEDAGGWHHDTLTEDLDLSYRAQLRGWRFAYLRTSASPSELPIGMNALRAQQFRWTKGSMQTALKTVRDLFRYGPDRKTKLEGFFHLTSHLVFPFILLAGLLHAPLFYIKGTAAGPGDLYFAITAIGSLAFVGLFLVQLFAQRSLYTDWLKRMTLFPLFLAGSMGFAINNTFAIAAALSKRPSPFVRTPKLNASTRSVTGTRSTWWDNAYSAKRLPRVVLFEMAMALYCSAGLVVIAAVGQWMALPFQAILTAGFGLVSVFNLAQVANAA